MGEISYKKTENAYKYDKSSAIISHVEVFVNLKKLKG
jgi:hypothetical protein